MITRIRYERYLWTKKLVSFPPFCSGCLILDLSFLWPVNAAAPSKPCVTQKLKQEQGIEVNLFAAPW